MYDANGNPTSYRGISATWEKGRQLKTYGANSYKYNESGIRISKTVGGVEHKYILNGSNVICEEYGNTKLDYLYDIDSSVCGMRVNNADTYYFRKNLQGDVIGITDHGGNMIANYRYDAWGKVLSVTGNTEIANLNSFRYRGYYYDAETQLYYLQSRYYDPELCRFINADSAEFVLSDLFNLFSYCDNNPISRMDDCGKFFLSATLFAAVFAKVMFSIAVAGTVVVGGILLGKAIQALLEQLDDLIQRIKEKAKAKNAEKKKKRKVYHHIIAKRAWRARPARTIWTSAKETVGYCLNINSSYNLAYINDYYHWYLHTGEYYDYINAYVTKCDSEIFAKYGRRQYSKSKHAMEEAVGEVKKRLEGALG